MTSIAPDTRDDNWAEATLPKFGESYFQWLDLLAAVLQARRCFTMLEFGAGYGAWGVRGILAARQRGIRDIRIGFVEADPTHSVFIRQHLGH